MNTIKSIALAIALLGITVGCDIPTTSSVPTNSSTTKQTWMQTVTNKFDGSVSYETGIWAPLSQWAGYGNIKLRIVQMGTPLPYLEVKIDRTLDLGWLFLESLDIKTPSGITNIKGTVVSRRVESFYGCRECVIFGLSADTVKIICHSPGQTSVRLRGDAGVIIGNNFDAGFNLAMGEFAQMDHVEE
jgi:hypothetical protein